MRSRRFYAEIFLTSMAVILLEISYTRVLSFKLFYYFTYLVIGVSLRGIGGGGGFVAISSRLRKLAPARLVPVCCAAAGVTVIAGYLVVAWTQLNAVLLGQSVREVLKLAVVCTFLFTPFLLAGLVIAKIFGSRGEAINRLYFADLSGAALGCALCVPLLYALSPPGTVWLSGLIFVVAGARLAASEYPRVALVSVPLAGILLIGVLAPAALPDPLPDAMKTMSPQQLNGKRVLFSQWSPVFRIDVLDWYGEGRSPYIICHDGMMGSTLHHFNGDVLTLQRFDTDSRSFPFRVLGLSQPEVLIIGAAGGHEILASLYFGAGRVTAIELNPVTMSLLTGHFAEYSGHLDQNKRVRLINAEGRSFMRRDAGKYDLIWFVAPDSYSAMNAATSSAFVLSESYLYTAEMIVESLRHLRDGGIISMSFGEWDFDRKPNRTARYLASAREAFRRLGVNDFDKHVLLVTSPSIGPESAILLKWSAFTSEEVSRFAAATESVKGSKVRHAWGRVTTDGAIGKVLSLSDGQLARWYAQYPYDIRPVTDDSPFFWHFVRFADALSLAHTKPIGSDVEDAAGERVLMVLLVFVIGFAGVFLLLPLVAIGDIWGAVSYKVRAGTYFAALGLGFMFFEISLIQKLTLFLGYPTYSLTVTLFALLVSTGIGSLLSERYGQNRNRALTILLGGILVLMLFYQLGMDPIVNWSVGMELGVRIGLAILFLAPLGICLGAFMPLGLQTVARIGDYPAEYVAWGWAVNGFFSVISSILATMLSMTIGFRMVQLVAVGLYAIGIAALAGIPYTTESAKVE
jgi:hypothetical protein